MLGCVQADANMLGLYLFCAAQRIEDLLAQEGSVSKGGGATGGRRQCLGARPQWIVLAITAYLSRSSETADAMAV